MEVFISVARDETRADSDVDILVKFEQSISFYRYMELKLYLEDNLETRVDLVSRRSLPSQWLAIDSPIDVFRHLQTELSE